MTSNQIKSNGFSCSSIFYSNQLGEAITFIVGPGDQLSTLKCKLISVTTYVYPDGQYLKSVCFLQWSSIKIMFMIPEIICIWFVQIVSCIHNSCLQMFIPKCLLVSVHTINRLCDLEREMITKIQLLFSNGLIVLCQTFCL